MLDLVFIQELYLCQILGFVLRLGIRLRTGGGRPSRASRRRATQRPEHEVSSHLLNSSNAKVMVPYATQVRMPIRQARRWLGGCAGVLCGFGGVAGLTVGAQGEYQDRPDKSSVNRESVSHKFLLS